MLATCAKFDLSERSGCTVGRMERNGIPFPMQPIRRCVVVDDDPDWIALIRRSLARSGLTIQPVTFADARRALAFLREHDVDCVVTDLRMPGVDGVELIQEFRRFNAVTPIVLFSSAELLPSEALAFGATEFVAKRAVTTELARTIEALLVSSGEQMTFDR